MGLKPLFSSGSGTFLIELSESDESEYVISNVLSNVELFEFQSTVYQEIFGVLQISVAERRVLFIVIMNSVLSEQDEWERTEHRGAFVCSHLMSWLANSNPSFQEARLPGLPDPSDSAAAVDGLLC